MKKVHKRVLFVCLVDSLFTMLRNGSKPTKCTQLHSGNIWRLDLTQIVWYTSDIFVCRRSRAFQSDLFFLKKDRAKITKYDPSAARYEATYLQK